MTSVSSGVYPVPWIIGLGFAFSTMVPMMAMLIARMIAYTRRRLYAEAGICALAVAFLCGGFQHILSGLDDWIYRLLVMAALWGAIGTTMAYPCMKEEFLWWRFKKLAWRPFRPIPL